MQIYFFAHIVHSLLVYLRTYVCVCVCVCVCLLVSFLNYVINYIFILNLPFCSVATAKCNHKAIVKKQMKQKHHLFVFLSDECFCPQQACLNYPKQHK